MNNSVLPDAVVDAGNGIQSVDRAVSTLEILARRGMAGPSEVAADLGVHKSTAFRLLGALEHRGLVEQAHDRGKYQLGLGILRLAGMVPGRLDLVEQGRPICEQLAAELGETVNLAVRRSNHVVNLDQARGPAAIAAYNWVGQLTPLHATSSGKILLAYQPVAEFNRIIQATGLPRYTPNTITSRRTLKSQLATALETGYATTCGEYETGLNAVAAALRDHTGQVVAAVSISGPDYRLPESRFADVAAQLIVGADQISDRMGYLARP